MTLNNEAKTQWTVAFAALLAGIIVAAHIGKVPPALPFIRSDLGLDLVYGGWVVSIFSGTGMIFGLVGGTVADRIGYRRTMLAGIAIVGLSSLAGAYAESGEVMLLTRFLEGVGYSCVALTGGALVAECSLEKDLQITIGIWGIFFPVGIAGMMLLTPLTFETYGWRGSWAGLGWASLISMAIVGLGLKGYRPLRKRTTAPTSIIENVRLTLGSPGAWYMSLAFGFYAVQHISLLSWLPTFLIEERNIGAGQAAVMTAMVLVVSATTLYLSSALLKRGVPRWVLMLISSVGMGTTIAGIFSGQLDDSTRYILCLVFGAMGGLLPMAALSGAPLFSPTRAQIGTTNGFIMSGTQAGQFLGTPALAMVVAAYGTWESGVTMMVGCAGVMVVISVLTRRVEREALARQAAAE